MFWLVIIRVPIQSNSKMGSFPSNIKSNPQLPIAESPQKKDNYSERDEHRSVENKSAPRERTIIINARTPNPSLPTPENNLFLDLASPKAVDIQNSPEDSNGNATKGSGKDRNSKESSATVDDQLDNEDGTKSKFKINVYKH